MTNKRNWLGMLVMMLVFGMAVVGCDPEPEEEQERWNKFYGTWVQASPVNDVSFLSAAEQAAGMGSTGSIAEAGGIRNYVKDGIQWYVVNHDLLWYDFTNTTYRFRTGSSGVYGTTVDYTFTEIAIKTGGGEKTYTMSSVSNAGTRYDILKWDSLVLTKRTVMASPN